jgi:hypothetical protein
MQDIGRRDWRYRTGWPVCALRGGHVLPGGGGGMTIAALVLKTPMATPRAYAKGHKEVN